MPLAQGQPGVEAVPLQEQGKWGRGFPGETPTSFLVGFAMACLLSSTSAQRVKQKNAKDHYVTATVTYLWGPGMLNIMASRHGSGHAGLGSFWYWQGPPSQIVASATKNTLCTFREDIGPQAVPSKEFGVPIGLMKGRFRVQPGGSWDLVTTYTWAYNPTYTLPNWPCLIYPHWKSVISPVICSY